MIYFLSILSYLLGSIPFGLIFGKLFQTEDLRKIGSGNIGATNAFRTGNKIVGILTFLFDFLKGMIPCILGENLGYSPVLILMLGCLSIVGHIFPLWLKFKGGKGIATTFGVILAVQPIIALVALALWIAIAKIFKTSSIAGLVAILFIGAAFFVQGNQQEGFLFLPIFALILYRHKDNITRLLNKSELHFKKYNE